jgi:hypothetical protein
MVFTRQIPLTSQGRVSISEDDSCRMQLSFTSITDTVINHWLSITWVRVQTQLNRYKTYGRQSRQELCFPYANSHPADVPYLSIIRGMNNRLVGVIRIV